MKTMSFDVERSTKETEVMVRLVLDGTGVSHIETGFGFLDHMLATLALHADFDLEVVCRGDAVVDDHHSVEDVAITLGQALRRAVAAREGVLRFGQAHAPLDEALVRCIVDLSGRAWPEVHLGFTREMIGSVATENLTHFFRSLAIESRMALHLDLIRGENDHHKSEAAFKALALALRQAVQEVGRVARSTKGVPS